MQKKILAFIFAMCLPYSLFASSACAGLTQICEPDMNNWAKQGQPYICTAIGTNPTFTIDMMNYGDVIASAIAGTALNGESTPLGTPACVAEAADTSWDDILATYFQIKTTFIVSTPINNDDFPHANAFQLFKMPSNDNSSYLGVKMAWCPCGSYTNGSCSTTPFYPYLNTPYTMNYNNPSNAPFVLGDCSENATGGLQFWVYTPNLQIPPIGTYSTDVGIQGESITVSLPGHTTRAKFVP